MSRIPWSLRGFAIIFLALQVGNGGRDWVAYWRAPSLDRAYQSLVQVSASVGSDVSGLRPGSNHRFHGNRRIYDSLHLFSPSLKHFSTCRISHGENEIQVLFYGRNEKAVLVEVLGEVEERDLHWISEALPKTEVLGVPMLEFSIY